MSWVLMTPLGWPVEPEVNRILAMVSGPTSACACSTADVGWVFVKAAKFVVGRSLGGAVVTTISASGGTAAAMARANAVPLAAKTRPGDKVAMIALSLPKSCDNKE